MGANRGYVLPNCAPPPSHPTTTTPPLDQIRKKLEFKKIMNFGNTPSEKKHQLIDMKTNLHFDKLKLLKTTHTYIGET